MTYDDLTNPVMGAYASFLSALTGLYLGVTTPGMTVTPSTLASVTAQAHQLAGTFISNAESGMFSYARKLGVERASDANAFSAVRVAVAQNIKTVLKKLRGQELGSAALLKNATGGMGLLVQSKLGQLDFRVSDNAGRLFDAQTLMRTTIRQFAIQTTIDAAVMKAEAAGKRSFTVDYPNDPEHGGQGVEVPISGLGLAEARRKIFHPNTSAVPHV
ncbi:hypothetical protein [Paraburkholderia sp.]|uniref:hypothetical protein n=1 Tax=Paraburkholderia sp. TaxID=1926495 RepID=UPI0039E33DE3